MEFVHGVEKLHAVRRTTSCAILASARYGTCMSALASMSEVRATTPPLLRVLLAEDDDEMRCLLAETMRADGHDVVEVRDALRMFDCVSATFPEGNTRWSQRYDVIVSDVRMPGSNGLKALAALRALRKPLPAIIIITAFGDEWTHRKARELGAVAVFDKPFEMAELRAAVHAAAAGPCPAAPGLPTDGQEA